MAVCMRSMKSARGLSIFFRVFQPSLFQASSILSGFTPQYVYLDAANQRRGMRYWVHKALKNFKRRRDEEGPFEAPRSARYEWNYNAEIFAFASRLREPFNEDLLRRAFTLRSYVNKETVRREELEIPSEIQMEDNEELASRGYALVSSYVKRYLRTVLRFVPEEGIQAIHDYTTKSEVVANVASHIGVKDLILSAEYPPNEASHVKTFFALVGALEASQNTKHAELFVQDFLLTQLADKDLFEMWELKNPMGLLASILKREGRGEPEVRLLRQAGPDTILAVFWVGIYSDQILIGQGPGESLEIAEEMAARDALRRLFHLEDSASPLPFGKQGQDLPVPHADKPNLPATKWTSLEATKNVVSC
ncbi:unnamed protein product [Darwinula stevensoni]|uniref:Large ribosomal subunit protein mL44 n=1 Tax=Darwinula stevensoni TaxID=69355 RepID=A0A7R8XK52_9CRUS|nr:unnamed protein product [Darwinula stevensoni]CAG0895410.1 unnamed protein product [Darwinula stevensoni]